MKIICKPEQSGKTFTMLNVVEEYRTSSGYNTEEGPRNRVINIFYCAKNLILCEQTYARYIEKFGDKETLRFSSKSPVKKYTDLWHRVSTKDSDRPYVDNIMVCTMKTRVHQVYTLIENLMEYRPDTIINIWTDEIHTFLNVVAPTLSPLEIKYSPSVNIYGLTATPKIQMWKLYPEGLEFVIYGDIINRELYHGWNDNSVKHCDFGQFSVNECITSVLEHHSEAIVDINGSPRCGNWFIPSGYKKSTHNETKDLLISKGFVVLVINGNGILLFFPGRKKYKEFKKDKNCADIIADIYRAYNLDEYNFAITGNFCIGEGISIQSSKFMFNYAILSSSGNKIKDSQMAGRLKGNIKKYDNYKPCIVFTTRQFDNDASHMESIPHKLWSESANMISQGLRPLITPEKFAEIKKTDKEKEKEKDKDYYIGTYEKCSELQKIFGTKVRQNKEQHQAPAELRQHDLNPTLEYVLARMWGLNANFTFDNFKDQPYVSRMVPVNEGNDWVVYWKPSKFPDNIKTQIAEFKLEN